MANSYFDLTGVLILGNVTPVIKALFGCYELDGNNPGNGQAYIANIAESSSVRWDSVAENLQKLVEQLNLDPDENGPPEDIVELLMALAEHFNVVEKIEPLIESESFEEDSDLETLFVLAQMFDDGHGLKAYKTESAWHCSKPQLFEFGGCGEYRGNHVAIRGSSNHVVSVGEQLESAIHEGDLAKAATVVHFELSEVINGIYDDGQRSQVRKHLLDLLQVDVSTQEGNGVTQTSVAASPEAQSNVCGECGASVDAIIGCPDGAEVCKECFDAGQH